MTTNPSEARVFLVVSTPGSTEGLYLVLTDTHCGLCGGNHHVTVLRGHNDPRRPFLNHGPADEPITIPCPLCHTDDYRNHPAIRRVGDD